MPRVWPSVEALGSDWEVGKEYIGLSADCTKMGAGRYRSAHGAHRPVCNGRYLVAHVGGMNCVPWNFVLFTAPVVAYLYEMPSEAARRTSSRPPSLACSAAPPQRRARRRGSPCAHVS